MNKFYKKLNKTAFWVCLSISTLLIIVSFILPPEGVIDPTVLTAVGEIFGFATLGTVISAVDKGADITVKKGDTEVIIDNPDNDEKQ